MNRPVLMKAVMEIFLAQSKKNQFIIEHVILNEKREMLDRIYQLLKEKEDREKEIPQMQPIPVMQIVIKTVSNIRHHGLNVNAKKCRFYKPKV